MRVVFIDHSFHKRTGSGDFLRDLITDSGYKIKNYWDDEAIPFEKISKDKYDFVFFFQYLPTPDQIRKISSRIIWAPMYDAILNTPDYTYFRYLPLKIKILSFSKNTTKRFKRLGFEICEVKYFIEPKAKNRMISFNKLNVFLWQRREISYATLRGLLNIDKVDHTYLLDNPDPGFSCVYPSKSDRLKHDISIIKGHLKKEKYLRILERCNIFICPRQFEGIGMSFLEAMANGMLIVSVDNPTMNEYIKDGQNGYLFKKPRELDITKDKLEEMRRKSVEGCQKGYSEWLKQRSRLVEYFLKEGEKIGMLNYLHFFTAILTNIGK